MAPLLYRPLQTTTATRLITLHSYTSTSKDSAIYCSLEEVDLKDRPSYQAVSYTWGIARSGYSIFVNKQRVYVLDNLWHFLVAWRGLGPANHLPLWVDSLCISQEDLKEKGHQVRLMGDIFHSAVRVLAWVGEHADGSERLFPRRGMQLEMTRIYRRFRTKRPPNPNPEDTAKAALWTAFLERPYFTRTWIVQEVVLARALLIICGKDAMTWEQMTGSSPVADPFHQRLSVFDCAGIGAVAIKNIERLVLLRQALETPFEYWHGATLYEVSGGDTRDNVGQKVISTSLTDLAYSFRKTQCTDPRDKVYAFLSLEHAKPGRTPIEPDYTLDVYGTFLLVFETRYLDLWHSALDARPSSYLVRGLATDLAVALEIMTEYEGELWRELNEGAIYYVRTPEEGISWMRQIIDVLREETISKEKGTDKTAELITKAPIPNSNNDPPKYVTRSKLFHKPLPAPTAKNHGRSWPEPATWAIAKRDAETASPIVGRAL